VQVHNDEGVANPSIPSQGRGRRASAKRERGRRIGQPLSREVPFSRVPSRSLTERQHDGRDSASAQDGPGVVVDMACATSLLGKPGDIIVGQRQHACCTGPCGKARSVAMMYDHRIMTPHSSCEGRRTRTGQPAAALVSKGGRGNCESAKHGREAQYGETVHKR